jgi:hypothetical protein
MARTIKVIIRARGVTDAPTVEDLLDQLRDYFSILEGVELALAEDNRQAIDWRITGASKASPLIIEAAPFPKDFAVNVERRSEIVLGKAALGLAALTTGIERPSFFTARVLERAEKMFERVLNGLDETIIDHGPGLPALDITPAVARAAAANVRRILAPKAKPYDELGSIEGNVQRIERDGSWRQKCVVHRHCRSERLPNDMHLRALDWLRRSS